MSDLSRSRVRRVGARVTVLAVPALTLYAFAAYYVAH